MQSIKVSFSLNQLKNQIQNLCLGFQYNYKNHFCPINLKTLSNITHHFRIFTLFLKTTHNRFSIQIDQYQFKQILESLSTSKECKGLDKFSFLSQKDKFLFKNRICLDLICNNKSKEICNFDLI